MLILTYFKRDNEILPQINSKHPNSPKLPKEKTLNATFIK